MRPSATTSCSSRWVDATKRDASWAMAGAAGRKGGMGAPAQSTN